MTVRGEITRLLFAWNDGDEQAHRKLLEIVRHELMQIARGHLAKEPCRPLDTTEVFHEAYLRLLQQAKPAQWESRRHFFSAISRLIRQVLVDLHRQRAAVKRGGFPIELSLDLNLGGGADPVAYPVLDEALEAFSKFDPQKYEIVIFRFLIGYSVEETAQILDISTPTVKRGWAMARKWLQKYLDQSASG